MALEEHLEVVVSSDGFDSIIAKARELEESLKAVRDAAAELDAAGAGAGGGLDGAIAKAKAFEENLKGARDAAAELDAVGAGAGAGLDESTVSAAGLSEELGSVRDKAAEAAAAADALKREIRDAGVGGAEMGLAAGASMEIYENRVKAARDAVAELEGAVAASDAAFGAGAGGALADAEAYSKLRDDAVEAAAAVTAANAASAGGAAAADSLELSSLATPAMVAGIGALVVGLVAAAPAAVAAGLGMGSFALLAAPAIEKVKDAYTNLSSAQSAYHAAAKLEARDPATSNLAAQKAALAQLQTAQSAFARLPASEQGAVKGVLSLKDAWEKLGHTSGIQKSAFGDIDKVLRIAKTLLPDVGTLAKAAEKPISSLLGSLSRDVKSSGFTDFIKSMAKEERPAIRSLGKLGGALTTFIGKDILQKLAPISPAFINSISHMVKAFGPGTGSLFKNAAAGLTSVDNAAAKAAPDIQAISRGLGHIATINLGNLKNVGTGIGALIPVLKPVQAAISGLLHSYNTLGGAAGRVAHDLVNIQQLVTGTLFPESTVAGIGKNPLAAAIAAAQKHVGANKLTIPADVKPNTDGLQNSLSALGKGGKALEADVKVKMDVSAATAAVSKLRTALTANLPSPKIHVEVTGAGAAASALNGIVADARGIPAKVASALAGLPGVFQTIGDNAATALGTGITAGTGAAVAAAHALASAVEAAAKVSLGISSPSKVFEKIGKDTIAGWILGLQGGKAQVAAAMKLITGITPFKDAEITDTIKRLTTKITEAFKDHQISKAQDSQMTGWVRADNKRLMKLAQERDKIEKEIKAADALAKSVAASARQGGSISAIQGASTGPVSAAGLESGMENQLSAIKKFKAEIKDLKKEGASRAVIRQIAQEGVAQGGAAAQALLAGGKGAISKISQLQHQIAQAAKGLGKTAANASYESGSQIGKGLAAGLKGELKGIIGSMKSLAKQLIDAIKKELKIHSPSGVMEEIGTEIPAGLAGGITSNAGSAAAAMRRLGTTTIGAFRPDPVHAAAASGGSSHGGSPTIVHNHIVIAMSGMQMGRALQSVSLDKARRNTATGLKLPNRQI